MLHSCVFGCRAYVFLSSKVYANKLPPYSEFMIFIKYENNGYCFICHIQGNIIFYFIHTIFDKKLFAKYTDSHVKECKLYNKLLDKISLEIVSLAPNSFGKDRHAPVFILHTFIPSIQNNPPTHSSSSSLSYKSLSLLFTPGSKKPTVEIEENNNVDSDIEIQLLSS